MSARSTWKGTVILATLAAGLARAANDEPFFFSAEAALMAGAVTATAEGPGALWYNPAGLGGNERNRLDLQATVLTVDQRVVRDGIVVRNAAGEQREDVDAGGFSTLSPSIAFSRRVKPGLSGAVGIFTTRSQTFNLAGGAIERDAPPPDSGVRIAIDSARTRYHIGGGVGWQARRRLRLGASLFGVYDQQRDNGKFALQLEDAGTVPETAIALTLDVEDESTRYGAQANLGLQWQPSERLRLGVGLWTPLYQFGEDARTPLLATTSFSGPGVPSTSDLTFEPESRPPTGSGVFEPARFTIGLARVVDCWRLSVEASYSPSLQAFPIGADSRGQPVYVTDRASVWNVRAGVLIDLREDLQFGAGLFTDRSPAAEEAGFAEFDVDYYGISTGVRSFETVRLAKGEGADTIVFEWSVALRYSYGTGEAGEARFDLVDGEFISSLPVDVVFQQFYIHLGSGLTF